MLKTFNRGGIHVPENKITAGAPIVDVPAPREAVVTFSQHIGAMAVCCVKVGDQVKRGQLIAKANGVVSANVHTPISGKVKSIGKLKTAFGYPCDTVTIVASDEDVAFDAENIPTPRTDEEIEALTSEEIKDIVADAGVVGLGGATFPT
ncbi:MAG: electron transporter RnfC, partial [Muribaculaceae bacterium]|nr:electron transporter RnfC [Muribaculaceae bacterium]